jgi:hypothetical protein
MSDAAKPLKTRESSASTYVNVDRMMELASESKKAELPPPEISADQPKDKTMWKIFLQLRPFLPYLARLVPVLDVALGPLQTAGMSHEVKETIAQSTTKIQSIQRDLTTAVTSAVEQQAVQLKRLEEEMIRLREAAEIQLRAQTLLAEDLRTLTRLFRYAVIGGAVLLVALIAMSALLLTQAAAR